MHIPKLRINPLSQCYLCLFDIGELLAILSALEVKVRPASICATCSIVNHSNKETEKGNDFCLNSITGTVGNNKGIC